MLEFRGGDGASIKTAVKIIGATSHIGGVIAEYLWLDAKFGERDKDYKVEMQSLEDEGKKFYDQIHIVLSNGTEKEIYFDVTDFFGKKF